MEDRDERTSELRNLKNFYVVVRNKLSETAFNKNWALVINSSGVDVVIGDCSSTTPTASTLSEALISNGQCEEGYSGIKYDVLFTDPKKDFPSDHLICQMMLVFG